jgi:crotonobetainyl-CoA:carnitine CoA-transferase CaiB-like acyl-CoA transferase
MFEAMASFLLVEQLSGQSFVPPLPDRGYGRLNSPYRRPYPAQDGYIAIMPYTAGQWRRFLRIVGRDDLADTPAITDDATRSAMIDSLYHIVEQAAPEKSCAEWMRVLRDADIPHAPVNRLEDLPHDPHMVETGFFKQMEHPEYGGLLYASTPFAIRGRDALPDSPPPLLDADRERLIADIGGRG